MMTCLFLLVYCLSQMRRTSVAPLIPGAQETWGLLMKRENRAPTHVDPSRQPKFPPFNPPASPREAGSREAAPPRRPGERNRSYFSLKNRWGDAILNSPALQRISTGSRCDHESIRRVEKICDEAGEESCRSAGTAFQRRINISTFGSDLCASPTKKGSRQNGREPFFVSGPSRTRTANLLIKSQLLYH